MSVRVFIGESFEYAHERDGFEYLIERLNEQFGDSADKTVTVMGNVMIYGAEIDLLIATETSLIVADLKNYGGNIEFSENGPWYADGREVKGGAQVNPFRQIRSNRFALFNWLNGQPDLINSTGRKWRADAMVIFHKPIKFDKSQVPPTIAKWLHVSDIPRAAGLVESLETEAFYISADTLEQFPAKLGLQPYDARLSIPEEAAVEPETARPRDTTVVDSGAAGVTNAINEFLASEEEKTLCLDAMAGIDPEPALGQIENECAKSGRDIIWLAPNIVAARALSEKNERHYRSIYTHLFDKSAKKQEKGLTQCGFRGNEDPSGCLYVLQRSHLVSNGYLQFEDTRFGSGHLFDDFLEFTGILDNKCQLVTVKDPFQLPRGAFSETLGSALFEEKNIPSRFATIEYPLAGAESSGILAVARKVASAIESQCFTTMAIEDSGNQVFCAPDAESRKQVVEEAFSAPAHDAVLLTSTNAQALEVNLWIRQNVLGFESMLPEPGDRVFLRNQIRAESNDGHWHTVNHGNAGTVQSISSTVVSKSQALKGREKPIALDFREIAIRFDDQPELVSKFLFLQSFLIEPSPELDSETLVALQVLAETDVREQMVADRHELARRKELVELGDHSEPELEDFKAFVARKKESLLNANPYLNAARLKYGYAITCHKAQSSHWPHVIIDAETDAGRHNEMYFRWIYTALTRASTKVSILNFVPLSPFDSVKWQDSGCKIVRKLPDSPHISFDPKRELTEEELAYGVPEGLSSDDSALIRLWLEIRSRLSPELLKIRSVRQLPYQEQYELADETDRLVTISIFYNGKHEVTRVTVLHGEPTLGKKAVSAICDRGRANDPVAMKVLTAVCERLDASGLELCEVKESKYLLTLTIGDQDSARALIDVHFDGQGMMTSILAKKSTDAGLLSRIEDAFRPTGSSP